jgi:uncharacterized protein (TIGR02147 family)
MKNRALESKKHKFIELTKEQFNTISTWEHLAFLSALEISDLEHDTFSIADFLVLPEVHVKKIIKDLSSLNIIGYEKQKKRWAQKNRFIANQKGLPSKSVRSYHRSILKKAYQSLESQNTNEREFSSMIMAVDSEKMDEAKKELREFMIYFENKFCEEVDATEKSEIYNLSLQYFRLSKEAEKSL